MVQGKMLLVLTGAAILWRANIRKKESKKKMSISIRPATKEDIPQILQIYKPHCESPTSIVTFEETSPSLSEMERRYNQVISNNDAYFVATPRSKPNKIIGYAYAHSFRPRIAYQFTSEISVYVKQTDQGLGVGRELMLALIKASKVQGKKSLIAVLGSRTLQSYYKKFGFRTVGVFRKVGYKAAVGFIDRYFMELVFE